MHSGSCMAARAQFRLLSRSLPLLRALQKRIRWQPTLTGNIQVLSSVRCSNSSGKKNFRLTMTTAMTASVIGTVPTQPSTTRAEVNLLIEQPHDHRDLRGGVSSGAIYGTTQRWMRRRHAHSEIRSPAVSQQKQQRLLPVSTPHKAYHRSVGVTSCSRAGYRRHFESWASAPAPTEANGALNSPLASCGLALFSTAWYVCACNGSRCRRQ